MSDWSDFSELSDSNSYQSDWGKKRNADDTDFLDLRGLIIEQSLALASALFLLCNSLDAGGGTYMSYDFTLSSTK